MKAGESSIIVAFRALVMLACLIVAPLAAIFGSAFPDLVRAMLVDPFLNRKNEGGAQTAQTPFLPAASGSVDSRPGASGAGSGNSVSNAPPWQAAGTPGNPSPLNPPSVGFSASAPYSAPATQPAIGYAPLAASAGPSGDPSASSFAGGGPRPAPANLARFDAPADPASMPGNSNSAYGAARATGNDSAPRFTPPGAAAPLSAATPSRGTGETEQFGWLEKRLRDAGATYYLLETWGAEGELYRFHCKMAVASNPNYTRHFEATDHDKLQAMSRVLEQVEAWRSGRLP